MVKFCLKFLIASIYLFTFYCESALGQSKLVIKPQKKIIVNEESPQWPTDNKAFEQGLPLVNYIQATSSGKPESGTFGCVRNNGQKFHEGIDIKSIKRAKNQVPLDTVYAILSGEIVYINNKASLSNYGKYIVLRHKEVGLQFYTLYAHLASISSGLKLKQRVAKGTSLGVMGNTSNFKIPMHLAHLHFEIGLQLGSEESFSAWYKAQKFVTPNYHGAWNGLNLVGLDPIAFFQGKKCFLEFIKTYPIAFECTVATQKVPEFIKHNTSLLSDLMDLKKVIQGWKIAFNWLGVPLSWTPVYYPLKEKFFINNIFYEELTKYGNRNTLEWDKHGNLMIGKVLRRQLFLLFEEDFIIKKSSPSRPK